MFKRLKRIINSVKLLWILLWGGAGLTWSFCETAHYLWNGRLTCLTYIAPEVWKP